MYKCLTITAILGQLTEMEGWSKQIAVNPSTAAYLSANVRYHNEGTAPVYDLRPISNFVLRNSGVSIATVTANGNTISNSLAPGAIYPAKGKSPIFLGQANESITVKMEVIRETLDKIQNGSEIVNVETTKNKGTYQKLDEAGQPVARGEWSPIRTNVDAVSGSLTLTLGAVKESLERADPEDKTPEITVKEAIKRAFGTIEKTVG
ncbi:hypothetical protein [Bacillus cereus group sp. BfR-BA-01349]|uniref:hypothetical protein n=1 Tax=Bacillus cereus group sp. BfR-BA-01349 TaxID=2920312 RepID=UPI001F591967